MNARLQLAAAAIFAAALAWGVWRYGATETWELYRLFLAGAVATLIVAWTLPAAALRGRWSMLLLLSAGCLLFAQVWLRPTLEARGFVLAALGWMALFISYAIASRGRGGVRSLVLFLILIGGIEAVYGLAQALGEPVAADSAYRAHGARGTFINRNHFAGMLNMILPLALGIVFVSFYRRRAGGSSRSETYAWTWVMLLSCSLMGLAILLSLSRGGVLILIATLAFMAGVLAVRRRTPQRYGLSGRAVWLLLPVILGLGLAVGLEALSARFAFLGQERLGRAVLYADSLRLIRDHAAFGVGPGMYRWRFRPYQTISPERRFDHAHNDYLETAADWGIPLAVAMWGFVGWRFYRALRRFFESRSILRQGLALGCLGAIFSILLHSLVDFNLQIPTNLMIFCVILGLAWSLEPPASARHLSGGSQPGVVA